MTDDLKWRELLGLGGAAALAGVTGAAAQTEHSPLFSPEAPRPNIILFMPDEMRADALGCYGNPVTRVADPQLLHNLYGQRAVAATQQDLQQRLLNWYINTTGVAPMDKDSRNQPAFYPTAAKGNVADLKSLLDH